MNQKHCFQEELCKTYALLSLAVKAAGTASQVVISNSVWSPTSFLTDYEWWDASNGWFPATESAEFATGIMARRSLCDIVASFVQVQKVAIHAAEEAAKKFTWLDAREMMQQSVKIVKDLDQKIVGLEAARATLRYVIDTKILREYF
jgi:type I site-specific restriction-modification system R (restriction) subunit